MSEQQAEQISGEPGSVGAGPAVSNSSDAQGEPVAASIASIGSASNSPKLVPEQGGTDEKPRAEMPKADPFKVCWIRPPPTRLKLPRLRLPSSKLQRQTRRAPRQGHDHVGRRARLGRQRRRSGRRNPSRTPGMFGKRRLGALAAVVALAAVAGALGGALATASLGHFAGDDTASVANHALEASVARIDADIQALKASVEHTSKIGMTQFNKTSDRLDKVEKAQARTRRQTRQAQRGRRQAPRHADRAGAAAAAAPAAAKEVTGSISPPAAAAASCAQGRSGEAADGGRLDAARRRQWRRPDRRTAGNLRSLCRRSGAGPRPGRCDPHARTATGWS